MKAKRKLLSILVTLSMLMVLLVPLATPAAAAATYTALTTPTVSDDTTATLGTVLIHTTAGAVYTGNAGLVNFKLPVDYEFDWATLGDPAIGAEITAGLTSLYSIPSEYSGDKNGFASQTFSFYKIAENEIQMKLTAIGDPDGLDELNSNDGYIYLYLKNVDIPSGVSGDIMLTASAPSSSGFGSGEVAVGKVRDSGEVIITVDEVNTFTDECDAVLRFKEALAGSFEVGTTSVKLRLPAGFEWVQPNNDDEILLWGVQGLLDAITYSTDSSGRDLILSRDTGTFGGTYFSLPVSFRVGDETRAKYGDVTVTISGKSTVSPSSLVIGNYGEMDATVKCDEALEVIAGKTEQEIGDIVIEETAPDSLVSGRSITLTLPSNAKWGAFPSISTKNGVTVRDNEFVTVGTDGKTIKFYIDQPSSSKPGSITLEDAEVILAVDTEGVLDIEVGGTAGVEGTITVANIVAPVTAAVEGKTDVIIGLRNQPAGDLIVTEGIAEAIAADKEFKITAPTGVTFSAKPKVEVTEGDLDIEEDNVRLTDSDAALLIPVRSESSTASTIKVTDIKLNVDRTVAVGDLKLKVKGTAVNEVNDEDVLDEYYEDDGGYYTIQTQRIFRIGEAFPGAATAASAVIATCVTPAPDQKVGTVVFTIDSTTYTVDGVEKEADVAPYIKGDRTYVSLRYVAEALGVSSENIIWNGADQTVVLIKGDRVVKITIGSPVMYINGVAFNMDVAPELVDPGRTMLPIRWVGQALGATLDWDAETRTVTVTI